MFMDIQAIWDQACVVMHREMTEVTFNTWIKAALRPIGAEGDTFYIEAVTDFYYSFVVPRYSVLIGNSLSEVAGRPIKAKILTPTQADKYRAGAAVEDKPTERANLNPKYTFDTFIVGPSNNQHFNLYSSIECQVVPANGYSEGQVQQAIAEVFRQEMPTTATFEYSNMSREVAEQAGSNTTTVIYCICVVLIYLILGVMDSRVAVDKALASRILV